MTELPVVLERPIDNTALSAYMACPKEFLFAMILHRRIKKGAKEKQALSYGSLWHKILENHYLSGGDPHKVMEAIEIWQGNEPGDHRTFERAMMDYQKYLKTWDPDKDLKSTIGFPSNPLVEIQTQIRTDELAHPYSGKIDRMVCEQDGMSFIEDHKTTSRLDSHYFDQFTNSNQMMGYTYIGQHTAPSHDIKGVRINLYHVLKNNTNFHRRVILFSKNKLREWVANYNKWIARVRIDYWAWLLAEGHATQEQLREVVGDGHLMDFILDIEAFPAHFGDNGCNRKYGLCTYFGICSLSPHIQMKALEQDFDVLPWNPLEVDDE